jgi:hypothetical protein
MYFMKALTISQPHAERIWKLEKWVENRNSRWNHVGPLAIHAGQGPQYLKKRELSKFVTGAIIAVANVSGCLKLSEAEANILTGKGTGDFDADTVRKILAHIHTEGPYCLVFASVQPLDYPVTCADHQGMWNVPCDAVQAINDQLNTEYT